MDNLKIAIKKYETEKFFNEAKLHYAHLHYYINEHIFQFDYPRNMYFKEDGLNEVYNYIINLLRNLGLKIHNLDIKTDSISQQLNAQSAKINQLEEQLKQNKISQEEINKIKNDENIKKIINEVKIINKDENKEFNIEKVIKSDIINEIQSSKDYQKNIKSLQKVYQQIYVWIYIIKLIDYIYIYENQNSNIFGKMTKSDIDNIQSFLHFSSSNKIDDDDLSVISKEMKSYITFDNNLTEFKEYKNQIIKFLMSSEGKTKVINKKDYLSLNSLIEDENSIIPTLIYRLNHPYSKFDPDLNRVNKVLISIANSINNIFTKRSRELESIQKLLNLYKSIEINKLFNLSIEDLFKAFEEIEKNKTTNKAQYQDTHMVYNPNDGSDLNEYPEKMRFRSKVNTQIDQKPNSEQKQIVSANNALSDNIQKDLKTSSSNIKSEPITNTQVKEEPNTNLGQLAYNANSTNIIKNLNKNLINIMLESIWSITLKLSDVQEYNIKDDYEGFNKQLDDLLIKLSETYISINEAFTKKTELILKIITITEEFSLNISKKNK